MLTTVAILLACVTGIASDYTTYRQSTTEGYKQKTANDYGLKDKIYEQIKRLSGQVDAAYEAGQVVADRLVSLIDDRRENSQQLDQALLVDLPALRQRQANQSDEIATQEQLAETLLQLTDEITVINSSLAEISRQAILLANESQEIEQEANDAITDNYQQEKRLAAVKAKLAEQDRKLRKLQNVTLQLSDSLEKKQNLVENITGVVDREQAEQTNVVLTRENPTATKSLEDDFSQSRPLVYFGISSIHIADESQSYVLPDNYGGKGYGGYQSKSGNTSISFDVDTTYNPKTNDATFTLIDSSKGNVVREVTVSATIITVDNGIFVIEDDVTQPATTKY